MIREFSLVFLLLISDHRNLHRDSRRDTEQNVPCSFSYLGHISCNDLYDDADLKAKSRQMYAESNTLHQKCHLCSTAVKVKFFTAYSVPFGRTLEKLRFINL